MICLDFNKVLDRMRSRKAKRLSWKLPKMTVIWEFIPVSQCRDYDGTFAGWNDRPGEVLQQTIWEAGKAPRYSNYWGAKL